MTEPSTIYPSAGPKAVNALLLDDDEFDRRRICRMSDGLGLPITMHSVPTLETMEQSMQEHAYDLVLVDYRLADGDGFSALNIVQASSKNRNAATIMISGNGQIELAVAALKAGCSDFLPKQDISPESLRTAILQALENRVQQFDPTMLKREAEHALISALRDDSFRQSLRPTIMAAMSEAAQSIAREKKQEKHAHLKGYLMEFTKDDDFCFQTGPLRKA